MIGSYLVKETKGAKETKEVSGDSCLVDNLLGEEEGRDVVVASTLLDEEGVEDLMMVLHMKVNMKRSVNGVLMKMKERSRCHRVCRKRRKMATLNLEPQIFWEVKMMTWERRIGKLHPRLLWKKGKRKKPQESRKTGEMDNRKIEEEMFSKEEEEEEWTRDGEDGLTTVEAEE